MANHIDHQLSKCIFAGTASQLLSWVTSQFSSTYQIVPCSIVVCLEFTVNWSDYFQLCFNRTSANTGT